MANLRQNADGSASFVDAAGNEAARIGGLGAFVGTSLTGPVFAMLGDSMTRQHVDNILPPSASPSQSYNNQGFLNWARMLSGQRFQMPPANNFGISGDTLGATGSTVGMISRLGNVLAAKPQFCTVLGGTNDLTNSRTYAQMTADWLTIVTTLASAGIRPICFPVPPRGGASALTTAQLLLQMRFNTFVREYCRANPSIIFIDPTPLIQDATTGAMLTGYQLDGLHPLQPAGYYWGKAVSDVLSSILPPNPTKLVSFSDYYDATNNPTGNLLRSGTTNLGMLAGTGGSITASTGFTGSGSVATGLTVSRFSGTSTATATCSKDSPRTDGPNSGERQVIVIASASGGGANEKYQAAFANVAVGGDIAVGDQVYAECSIDVSGLSNVMSVQLELTDNRPSNSQLGHDMLWSGNAGIVLPAAYTGVMRTAPLTIQSDSTAVTTQLVARLKSDTATAGVTLKLGDWSLRKVGT